MVFEFNTGYMCRANSKRGVVGCANKKENSKWMINKTDRGYSITYDTKMCLIKGGFDNRLTSMGYFVKLGKCETVDDDKYFLIEEISSRSKFSPSGYKKSLNKDSIEDKEHHMQDKYCPVLGTTHKQPIYDLYRELNLVSEIKKRKVKIAKNVVEIPPDRGAMENKGTGYGIIGKIVNET
ncbi:hypothetical protein CWI38_1462p0020 [Hamiltosporidium tvaerminnensis]|uniref:Uncharacterized protein n=1 Tax=Hamiltosporidium tvaerminnensis TaxID=1176355 RepID=A0A4Q9LTR3_9MICR|nr:hypothetical protein CWI38_1462p0020 [Hamiltosporidium tvaerminnensis]